MNRAWAILIVRWVSGVIWLMAGWWKCFELGPGEHARVMFVERFAESWMPEWLLQATGTAVPVIELVAGAMLILGFRTRLALIALGGVLVLVTYGHTLENPLFDISGHIFTRGVMVVFLLMMPSADDRLSLDARFSR